jgi:sulfotransferase
MKKRLNFVSGLPRSGSTLLMNLLVQNPGHHVTPTSGLVELFLSISNSWTNFVEFRAEGLDVVKPRILSALKGLMQGYFEDELTGGKVVFDKSRAWLQFLEPLEEALGHPVKVIVPVRDVRAIIASFEKLYRNRSIDYPMPQGEAFYRAQSIEGRADVLLAPSGVVGMAINRLRDALRRGVGDRLVIVPYSQLTDYTDATLSLLHQSLELEPFAYDPQHVSQVTQENDVWHGMDLHRIRSRVSRPAQPPWEDVLPTKLCDGLARDYADINQLAAPQVPCLVN